MRYIGSKSNLESISFDYASRVEHDTNRLSKKVSYKEELKLDATAEKEDLKVDKE